MYPPRMDGYMIDVDSDETRIVVRGKNKPARIALAGQGHDEGDVTILRSTITSIDYKPPRLMGNGNLTISTTDGRRYQLHFLKKHQAGFERLAQELGATA